MTEELVRVTALNALSNMTPLSFNHRGVPYAVVKVGGDVKAYIALCSHEDKPFKPRVKQGCLVCPFHKVCFDAATGRVTDPNGHKVPEGLPAVSTEVRDGWVYLAAREEHRTLMARSAERAAQRRARKRARPRGWFGIFGRRGG